MSFVCQSIGEVPPPLHATDDSTFLLLFTSSIFKDTLYFLLKYVLLPVLFTLTQVVLLLITSTFTRVQIQSNLGTTGPAICNFIVSISFTCTNKKKKEQHE